MVTTPGFDDERRLQVLAYHDWVSAANGREFPSLADMQGMAGDAALDASFVLNIGDDILNPRFIHVGSDLLTDCDVGCKLNSIDDVPARTLLSRLSDKYLESYSNRVPVGYEASFEDRLNRRVSYRGILLPLSSDGRNVDHVWGLVNGIVDAEDVKGGGDAPVKAAAANDTDATVSEVIEELARSRKEFIERVRSRIEELLDIDGVMCAALVDRESRTSLVSAGEAGSTDLTQLASGTAQVLSEKQAMLKKMGLSDERIEDILFAMHDRYHLIQPVCDQSGHDLFVLVISDRAVDNIAMTKFKVGRFEDELVKV